HRLAEHRVAPGCGLDPAAGVAVDPGAAGGPDPQVAVPVEHQRVDRGGGLHVLQQAVEAVAGPARQALVGAHPQPAAPVHAQPGDRRRRQAARVARLGHEAADAAVLVDPVQATVGGAEPDRAIGRLRHRPDIVAADLRVRAAVEMDEAATPRIEHRQATVLRAHPDPVASVDEHDPDMVVVQAVADAPDPVADAVVAREPVAGGDPQIALAILG